MRVFGGLLVCVVLIACACTAACRGTPSPPPLVPVEEEPTAPPEEPTVVIDSPAKPPSTASYDEALAVPEPLDVNDDRAHLTDGQLSGPMRGVLSGCRVPSNAHVTIKTAVQNGRAIGVTVTVAFEHPKSMKRVPPSMQRAEAKTSTKVIACADHAARAISWPPNRRRDSFTTVF